VVNSIIIPKLESLKG